MTVKEHFNLYLRILADRLALKDWDFQITDNEIKEDGNAEIECVFGRKLANIGLASDFLEWPLERQRHTLVHEVLHAHYAMLWEFGCNSIPKRSKIVFQMLLEYSIDGITDAIAPMLPLPEPYYKSSSNHSLST